MRNHPMPSALAPIIVAGLVAGCGGDSGDGPGEPAPIVFAHGCPPPPFGSADDAGFWTGDTQQQPGLVDFLADRGYADDQLNVFVYPAETCPPNRDYAAALADYVNGVLDASGRSRVDLVGYSMGVVASRIFLRQGGDALVEDFVSISGANHGSILAEMIGEAGQAEVGFPAYQGALEAAPAYACEGESTDADVQFFLNGCLTEDGRTVEEDETPTDIDEGGHIRYLAIWNSADDLVVPPQSSCLNQAFKNDCSDPVNVEVNLPALNEVKPGSGLVSAHVEVQFSAEVWQAVYDFVAETR